MSIQQKALSIAKTGSTYTSSGTSAIVALPTNNSGNKANVIRVVSNSIVFVKLITGSTGTATENDIMITTQPTLLVAQGFDHLAYIQDAANTAGKVNITVIEY